MAIPSKKLLVSGIYLAQQKTNIEQIVRQFNTPCQCHVLQKWIAISDGSFSDEVRRVTVMNVQDAQPKFILLNQLLSGEELENYDFIIFSDDDISLPEDFLQTYLDIVIKCDFAIAQPARTHNSYIDHPFVEQLDGLKARRTRFVEIGPVFSIRKDAFSLLLPFNEASTMGWGYDFVWPCLIEDRGLKMGIIDATPVEHTMRKPVQHYDYNNANEIMKDYLSKNRHLDKNEAFRILESFA
jgi:hypothetical protein